MNPFAERAGSEAIEGQHAAIYHEHPLFAGNKKLTGTGTGARVEFKDIDASFLEWIDTKWIETPIEFEGDSTKWNYLHPVAGSDAAKMGAGFFVNPLE